MRQETVVDEFIVMPNPMHDIVMINNAGANGRSPDAQCEPVVICEPGTGRSAESPRHMKPKSISSFVAGFEIRRHNIKLKRGGKDVEDMMNTFSAFVAGL